MKESSRFYSSLGLLVILNLVIKPVWIFAIDRQVQNTVGLQEYGQYFSIFNLSVVLSFLLDWGMTPYFNRQLASQQESFFDKTGYFLLIKLLLVLVYAGIVLTIAYFTGIERWDIVWAVILIQVLTSLFLFFRNIVTAQQWFQTDAWLSVLDKLLMTLLCGSFLFLPYLFGKITIDKFLWTQVACTAVAIVVVVIILLKRSINFSISRVSLPFTKQLFVSALPFAIIVLLMSVHYRIDGFLLERLLPAGSYEAGVYAGAYRLLDAANMIGFLFASFLLPFLARQWNNKAESNAVILSTRHLLMAFSIGFSCIAFFMAPWIQQLLYRHTDANAVEVLQYCIPALIGYSLVSIYGTVMTATGHIKSFCVITLFSVLLNIGLNLSLIPSIGALGCCIAALVSQTSCGIATMIYVNQKLGVSLHFRSLLTYIFIAILLGSFLYWGDRLAINKLVLFIAVPVITLSVLLLTKLLRPAEWIASLRKSHL